jgi:hypothetical protein
MKKEEIFYLIGKCLTLDTRTAEEKQQILEDIKADRISWTVFVKIASDHLVLPVIYINFRDHDFLKFLPDDLVQHLQHIYNLNLERNKKILKQIDEINQLLSQSNITPIYLKGAGNLLDGLYPDIGARMMGDIDFLVSDDDFLKAADILKNVGYFHTLEYVPKFRYRYKHYPRMGKKGTPAEVEIHRRVVYKGYKYFGFELIDKEKKRIPCDYPCYVMSDRHNLIMNLYHAYLADELSTSTTLRLFYDYYLLSQKVDAIKTFEWFGNYLSKAKVYVHLANDILSLNQKYIGTAPLFFYLVRFNYFIKMKYGVYDKIYYYLTSRFPYLIKVFFSEYGITATKYYLKRNYSLFGKRENHSTKYDA